MGVYYNEFDPGAAAWLRNLAAAGHVAPGTVDERSIAEVRPADLAGHDQCHFFAGIGGWPHALDLAGWPRARPVWTGSCPCQPYSTAGKGLGNADARNLWPVFFALIRECRPDVVFGEQVASAIGHGWLDGISADLEAEGYAVGACVLGAHSVGAPHIRQRLYWVAHAQSGGAARNSRNRDCSSRAAEGSLSGGRSPLVWDLEFVSSGTSFGGVGHADGEGAAERGEEVAHDQRRGADGGVADPYGGQSGDGELQRGGEYGLRAKGRCDARSAEDPERASAGGLGDANDQRKRSAGQHPARARNPCGAGENHWSDSRFIRCRDNKYRRVPVEPALFPLAHGVPGRVGLLRGSGNAIVPQVAAEFVKAFLACTEGGG